MSLTFLSQYSQALSHCQSCDYLFVPDPFWLDEAYGVRFFGDTGLVRRNIHLSKRLLPFICALQNMLPEFKGLDYGSGTGMFCRMMRDEGVQFLAYDPYADSELCRPFIMDSLENETFGIVTAFEVMEHVPNPKELMAELSRHTDQIVFTTTLRKVGEVPGDKWWYYAPEIGQHVAFHSPKSLEALAGSIGSKVSSARGDLHLFSPSDAIHEQYRSLLSKGLLAKWRRLRALNAGKRESLTWPDHYFVKNELVKKNSKEKAGQ